MTRAKASLLSIASTAVLISLTCGGAALAQAAPSPVVELNRAAAIAEAGDPEAALLETGSPKLTGCSGG